MVRLDVHQWYDGISRRCEFEDKLKELRRERTILLARINERRLRWSKRRATSHEERAQRVDITELDRVEYLIDALEARLGL